MAKSALFTVRNNESAQSAGLNWLFDPGNTVRFLELTVSGV